MHGTGLSAVNAFTAHREWATRPPDERFTSVQALYEAARTRRDGLHGARATRRRFDLSSSTNSDAPAHDVLPTALVVRASCGGRPPPGQQDPDEPPRRSADGTSPAADGRDRSRTTHTRKEKTA